MRLKYINTLSEYLKWLPSDGGCFLQPKKIEYNQESPDAAHCMFSWESKGIITTSTSEPELLQKYQQGKILRDWHISEWRDGVRMNLFRPIEFVGTLGCTLDNYKQIFSL